jgi:predicted nuclease with TOPRIM domain
MVEQDNCLLAENRRLAERVAYLERELERTRELVRNLSDHALRRKEERDTIRWDARQLVRRVAELEQELRESDAWVLDLAKQLVRNTVEYQNSCPCCGMIVDWHTDECAYRKAGKRLLATAPTGVSTEEKW